MHLYSLTAAFIVISIQHKTTGLDSNNHITPTLPVHLFAWKNHHVKANKMRTQAAAQASLTAAVFLPHARGRNRTGQVKLLGFQINDT